METRPPTAILEEADLSNGGIDFSSPYLDPIALIKLTNNGDFAIRMLLQRYQLVHGYWSSGRHSVPDMD
jgi:hypothetical protein